MKREYAFWIIAIVVLMFTASLAYAQEILPFPEPPSARGG